MQQYGAQDSLSWRDYFYVTSVKKQDRAPMKYFLLITFIISCFFAFAQKERDNWYFGHRAALSFSTGTPVVKYDNPQQIYKECTTVSDPQTGTLLFYSNGDIVWNRLHQAMPNGMLTGSQLGSVVAFPVPGSTDQYYMLFTNGGILKYVIIDMTGDAGKGVVKGSAVDITTNLLPQFTVVKHRYKDAYWVVTHQVGNNTFVAYEVNASGFPFRAVSSSTGMIPQMYGDMVGSNKSHKLAVTHFTDNGQLPEVFDFDAACGTVSNAKTLSKDPAWDYPFGIAFSPDDAVLYIAYSVLESHLVQYSGKDYQDRFLVATSPQNYNVMRMGPDQKIYIATHDNSIPGPRVDAILNPNARSAACDYRRTFLNLDDGTGRNSAFEFPAFVSGKSVKEPDRDGLFRVSGYCIGDTFKITFEPGNPYDSMVWDFGDGDTSRHIHPSHLYKTEGVFELKLTLFKCGDSYVFKKNITIKGRPLLNFPEDTIVCAGTLVALTAPLCDQYKWSTGATTQSVMIDKPGIVWLNAFKGICQSVDSIEVRYHPDIFTSLDSLYFLCEDDSEMVKLDAGEGFQHYKWLPTSDTTQWIIVKSTGDYFVKVTDHFGCMGDDGAKVKRRCGVLIHFPNAFTPNGDGLNDAYKASGLDVESFYIRIYNSWGELMFESDHIDKAWDGNSKGKPAADGVYVYHAQYTGVKNKRLQLFHKKGNITLIR